jgi:hypothetical protein
MNFENVGSSFALIVGVSRYPHITGQAGDLRPAFVDVEKMVAYIESAPENFDEVVVLLDDQVTADNLNFFLTRYFPRRLEERPGSRFLFTYSGHGMTDEHDRGYLLTSEATSLHDRFNGLSMFQVRAQLQGIIDSGFQVLALINACYSSDFHRMALNFGDEDKVVRPNRPGAHVITAGGSGEPTWHDPNYGIGAGPKGSVFFEAVIAALEGRADRLPQDGIVSVGELETFVKSEIQQFTDDRQNPMGGDLNQPRSLGGFFFFDRADLVDAGAAQPLKGQWWSALSFGAGPDESIGPETPIPHGGEYEFTDPARGDNQIDMVGALVASLRETDIADAAIELSEVQSRFDQFPEIKSNPTISYSGNGLIANWRVTDVSSAQPYCDLTSRPTMCQVLMVSPDDTFQLDTLTNMLFGRHDRPQGWVDLGKTMGVADANGQLEYSMYQTNFSVIGSRPDDIPTHGNIIKSKGEVGMQFHDPGTPCCGSQTPTYRANGRLYLVVDVVYVDGHAWAQVVELEDDRG